MAKKKSAPKKLAKKITVVKRETKRSVKNIQRSIKAVKGTAKKISKLFAPKKTTAKKKASSKSGKPQPKKSPKVSKVRSQGAAFSLSKLSGSKFKSPIQLVNYVEANEDEIDSQLHNPNPERPTEFFVATFFGNRTVIPYTAIRPLVNRLNTYIDGLAPGDKQDGLHSIKVMKLKTTTEEFRSERQIIVEGRKMEREETIKEAKVMVGSKHKATNKRFSVVDLLKGSLQQTKEARKEVEALRKENEDFKKMILKLIGGKKPTKKKAVKRVYKKTVSKSKAKKSTKKVLSSKSERSKKTVNKPAKKKAVVKKSTKRRK